MKRINQIGLLSIIICFWAVSIFGQGGTLYVKVKGENVRVTPNGDKIGEIVAGTKVNILERRSKWVKVQFSGWIWENSLTPDSTMVHGFTMRASHILLKTEEEANRILNQLGQGADFEELANTYSIDKASGMKGGDVGSFSRGDFMPEFEESVLNLKIGQISGVVRTALGYHIIKRTK